jgi:hypothetical protein
MCELASTHAYWDAVRAWLHNWNGRLFLALSQLGIYHLPLFSDPLRAPWFLLHGLSVLAHLTVCGLLFHLLTRAGLKTGGPLTMALLFAVHPIASETVLFLAVSFGYVLGTLVILLSVWAYLEYERRNRVGWLTLSTVLALLATLAIEQYIFVLCALAGIHLIRSRWHKPAHSAWIPIRIVFFLGLVFSLTHFYWFPSTSERIATATVGTVSSTGEIQESTGPGLVWLMAWWLSIVPDASPYGGTLKLGLGILREHLWLIALITLVAIGSAWNMAAAKSWRVGTANLPSHTHLWLFITGTTVFIAALLPFLVTGKYGIASRNMYIALPGLLIVGATTLDLLSGLRGWKSVSRVLLAPGFAVFMAMSLAIDFGEQYKFALSWRLHQDLIREVQDDTELIRASKAVEVLGIPAVPYKAISQLGDGWPFPCLVRWVVDDSEVRAWNNLMLSEKPWLFSPDNHRIYLRGN